MLHIYHIYLSHSNIDISKSVALIWVALFICSYCGCNVIRGSSYRNLHKLLTLLKGQKGHDNFFSGWYYMALWRYNISLQRVANLAKLPWVTEREHSPKPYTKTLPLRVVGIFSLSILCRGLILLRNSKVQRTWWKSVNSPSATLITNKEKWHHKDSNKLHCRVLMRWLQNGPEETDIKAVSRILVF